MISITFFSFLPQKNLLSIRGVTANDVLNEDKNNKIIQQLELKERNKLSQLDNYCIFLSTMYLDTIKDHINLIQVTKPFKLNMEKFFFNPVSLNYITREFFPYLQTLFIYDKDDDLFEFDERIISRKKQMTPYYLTSLQKK